jgi:RNA polymerase sigma-70 factor (ECF subfamily)
MELGWRRPAADREEFEKLLSPHATGLYNAALRLSRDADDAADLFQEAVLRAFRNFGSFREKMPGGQAFRSWMYRILTNCYINEYHRQGRRAKTVSMDAMEGRSVSDLPDERRGPATLTMDNWEFETIVKAIRNLPEEYKKALIYVDLQDLTYQEAAEALSVPIGTVRSRVSRGRAELRQRLRGILPELAKEET